ncbi:MAG TPA: 5-formyltetrahydrofolate cyclo-ligase [Actinomycetota bacterium]|nr:5-formyltetrahydrofolate cyclo-ligase [Actinomycetota bacterium]
MTSNDPRADKTALRRRMREARAAIPEDERARRSSLIEDRLFALREMTPARTVLIFYSFGTEVGTRSITERARAHGKRVLLPYLDGSVMEAAEVERDDELVQAWYGAREPARRTPVAPAEIDLVVAPGLAFDRAGGRLGYGGGHYDRYLGRLGQETIRVGIGFAVQVVDAVPRTTSDEGVHMVVTEDEVIDCRRG